MNTKQIERERAKLLKNITVVGNNRYRATPTAEQALANSEERYLRLGRQFQEQREKARTRRASVTTT